MSTQNVRSLKFYRIIHYLPLIVFILSISNIHAQAIVDFEKMLAVEKYDQSGDAFVIQLFSVNGRGSDVDQNDSWSNDDSPHFMKINGSTVAKLVYAVDGSANGYFDDASSWVCSGGSITQIDANHVLQISIPSSYFVSGSNTITFEGVWKERIPSEDDVFTFKYLTTTVNFPKPEPAVNVQASTDEYGHIHLSWSSSGSNFDRTVVTKHDGGTNTSAILTSNPTTWVDNAAYSDAATYEVQFVYDWNEELTGNTDVRLWSPGVSVTPPLPPRPTTPTNFQATTDRCDGIIRLTWDYSNPNVTDPTFFIERSDGQTHYLTSDKHSFEDNIGSDFTTYNYEIRAIAQHNYYVTSNSGVASVTGSTEGIPSAPYNFTAQIQTTTSAISLDWNAGAYGQDQYFISKITADNSIKIDDIPDGQTDYVDDNVSACVTYDYQIYAANHCKQNGVPSAQNVSIRINPDLSNTFASDKRVVCSKGYYPDKIVLNWQYNNDAIIERIKIYRKEYGSTAAPDLVATIDPTTTYEDYSAEPGIYYEYTVVGELGCENDILASTQNQYSKDVGFRVLYGTVSGNVSYKGGNSVEGVQIIAETEDSFNNSGVQFTADNSNIRIPNSTGDFDFSNEFTFQAWIRPTANDNRIVFSKGSQYTLRHSQNRLEFTAGGQTLALDFPEKQDTFFCVNAVRDADSLYLSILYDELTVYDTSAIFTGTTPSNTNDIYIGATTQSFLGYIEDIRIWNKALIGNDMIYSSIRYLAGNEKELKVYYKLNEMFYNQVFDISRKGTSFNKHHGFVTNAALSSTVPFKRQLSVKGITDANGNYLITGIPYTVGSVYTFTPVFEVHEFDPHQKQLYIGNGSNAHSNVDFIDIAAFKITGVVTYENTNFPVKGVSFEIDGKLVTQENGLPIVTDDLGRYEIYVPIGWHHFNAVKYGHVFTAGGRYPEIGNWNFQAPLTGIDFKDSTLIKVVGRCVGGAIQAEKPIALGQTKNNIGNAEIILTTQREYDLTDQSTLVTGTWDNQMFKGAMDSIVGTTGYQIDPLAPKQIKIYPDTETGEFTAYLLPEKYIITGITAGKYTYDDTYHLTVDLSTAFNTKTETDTVVVGYTNTANGTTVPINRIDSAHYQYNLPLVYREKPELSVTNKDGGNAFWDSTYTTKDGTVIRITNPDGSPKTWYPVFRQRRKYTALISLFESYENIDNNNEIDIVPVKDGIIEIQNFLSTITTKQSFQLDKNGQFKYIFTGGLPNITTGGIGDYLLSMSITAFSGNNHTIQTEWAPGGGTFKAYLLGGLPTGNNFVTTGPNKIEMILRDPPGSNSYAYYEVGNTVSKTSTYNVTNSQGGSLEVETQFGASVKTFQGIGAGVITEVEYDNSVTVGFEHSETWVKDNTTTTSTTNTKMWQTSASEDYVGDEGDVFIGYATNIVYGASEFVDFFPTDKGSGKTDNVIDGYQIGRSTGLRISPQFKTGFQYTQYHIENYLIPNLKKLRNDFLLRENSDYQCVICDVNDPEFGRDNTTADSSDTGITNGDSYNFTIPASWPADSVFIDSVHFYNKQIAEWEKILADNEKEKLNAKLQQNISFDAGSIYESSETWDTVSTKTKSFEFTISPSLAGATGFSFNKLGVNVSLSESYSHTKTKSSGEEEASTVTIGYHLEDGNQGDYYSIDIKKGSNPYGPIFITRGGQSMCPYEGEKKTKYYNKGSQLQYATMKREVPRITCKDPIAENVQEDVPALFEVQLANMSETGEDQWMLLKLDEKSNQDGALLEMDGSPLFNGRLIYVPAGQSINKIISVKKVVPDVYAYNDLALILRSPCQETNADTVRITAHFIPVCTDVTLNDPDDQWIVNTTGDTTMLLNINGYDLHNSTFDKLTVYYKSSSTPNWTADMVYYINEDDYNTAPNPKELINNRSELQYILDMKSMQDRIYQIKVTSHCTDNTINDSEIKTGIKDVKPPRLFGSAQPADGILEPNDEVMLTFDEDIYPGDLTTANFSVRGVLNGDSLKHQTCLYFDGVQDYASAVAGVNLDNKSWTIEFWARRADLKPGVLFAQNALEIGFNAANQIYFKAGNQQINSNQVFDNTDTWFHFGFTYDYKARVFSIYINDKIDRESIAQTAEFYANGKMYLGRNKAGDSFFNGYMHEFRIWEKALGFGKIYAQMYVALTGNEIGLAGYWKMNEAHGDIAQDFSRAHHAFLFGADWRVFPSGYARTFDGNAHLEINTGSSVVITKEQDFTIELYFKGQAQANTVLFSNGAGDGTDYSPHYEDIWLIGFNAEGKLYVKNNGVYIIDNENDYLDNQWHHLAVVCNRPANTSLYVDGKMQAYAQSALLGGLASAEMTLGSRRKYVPGNLSFDQYFNGSIDELRIWNLARSKKQLNMDMNAKLRGDEVGLLAYYPFDKYDNLGAVLIPTLEDITGKAAAVAVTVNGNADNTDVPNIKDARPVKKVNFDWVVNDDQLIININEQPSAIEKCILEFTVQNVKDLRGNKMASPVTWTAYIKKNSVIWDEQEINLEKEVYKEMSFQTKILNKGGTEQTYSITGLPNWLSVDEPTGTLAPDSYKMLTFTVDPVVNVGNYNFSLFLTSDFGYAEKLNINLDVKQKAPDWNVDENNYQYTMSVIGQLKIDGVFSTNPDDMVGAFVDGECRGVAKCEYVREYDMYEVFLNIYSNKQSGEQISFKIWNASEGYIHINVTPVLTYVYNNVIGSPANPQIIESNNSYSVKEPLSTGWTWISFNLSNDNLKDVAEVLKNVHAVQGDQIKGQNVFAGYSDKYGWNGSLVSQGFNNTSMYMVKLQNNDTLKYWGAKLLPANIQIPIKTGWNWISYTPNVNISVRDAFANYQPASGDVVKSQFEFSMYDENLGWIGSLDYMIPGKGYMYYTSNPDAYLTFPASGIKNTLAEDIEYQTAQIEAWKLNERQYAFNMSMVAKLDKSGVAISDNYVIGAFAGNECRGIIAPEKVQDQELLFMTIFANTNDEISFKLIDLDNNTNYQLNETVLFKADNLIGAVQNPMKLTVSGKDNSLNSLESFEVKAYPNPFSTHTNIQYTIQEDQEVQIEIYNSLGHLIKTVYSGRLKQGAYSYQWDGTNNFNAPVPSGMYLIKITGNMQTKSLNIIKK